MPKVLDYFQDRQDKKHELAMQDKILEQQIQLGKQKLHHLVVDSEIREIESLHKEQTQITKKASQFWINVSSSVRPVMAYLLFGEFLTLTFLLAFDAISMEMYTMIWNEPMQGVYSAIICFYFGQRSFNKK